MKHKKQPTKQKLPEKDSSIFRVFFFNLILQIAISKNLIETLWDIFF